MHTTHDYESSKMNQEKLSRVLEEVGLRDGITDLHLNHEGTAALRLTGGRHIYFEYQEDLSLLFLYIGVCDLPPDVADRMACMEAMLGCNFLKLGTGRGELAISLDKKQATYQVALDATTLNPDSLDRAIDALLKQHHECLSVLKNRTRFSNANPPTAQGSRRFQITSNLEQRANRSHLVG